MSVLDSLLGIPDRKPAERRPGTFLYDLIAAQPDPLGGLAGGGGPAGGGGGAPGNIKALARKLEGMGFDVGELEGFGGQGQISSGHATNSLHYAGNAMDVNYRGAGRWKSEPQALSWLARFLKKRYDPKELFWPGNDPVGGHDTHLHFGL